MQPDRVVPLDHDRLGQLAELETRLATLLELGNIDHLAGDALERYWMDLERYGEMEALRRAADPFTPAGGG